MTTIHHSVHQSSNDITDRILEWHDEAKRAGRVRRAEELLNLAWSSYDCCRLSPSQMPMGAMPCMADAAMAG